MAHVIKIVSDTDEINLYAPDTSGLAMLAEGNRFGLPETENVYHESDWENGARLARKRYNNRTWNFALAVSGTEIGDLFNRIERASEQASLYQIDENVGKVYLYIQLDGFSVPTYYDIIDIKYDSAALFEYFNMQDPSHDMYYDQGLLIEIETEPEGYGDEILLRNHIYNPHFHEVPNGTSIPEGWNEELGSLSTHSYKLVGKQGARVICDSNGDGKIYSSFVSVSEYYTSTYGSYAMTYVWVHAPDGGEVQVYTEDINGSQSSYGYYSNPNATYTDSGGREWRRIMVHHALNDFENPRYLRLHIERVGGVASSRFYVDKAYMQPGFLSVQTDPPDGWCSCSWVSNHFDWTDDDYKGAVPYIDYVDILGGAPSDVRIKARGKAGTSIYNTFVGGAHGEYLKTFYSFDVYNGVINDATRIGDGYNQYACNSSNYTTLGEFVIYTNEDYTFHGPVVAFAIVRTHAAVATLFKTYQNLGLTQLQFETEPAEVDDQSAWHLVPLGGLSVRKYKDYFAIVARGIPAKHAASSSANVDLDEAIYMPIWDSFHAAQWSSVSVISQSRFMVMNSKNNEVIAVTDQGAWPTPLLRVDGYPTASIGKVPRLWPGEYNRLSFLSSGNNGVHDLAAGELEISLWYTPRTYTVLGAS